MGSKKDETRCGKSQCGKLPEEMAFDGQCLKVKAGTDQTQEQAAMNAAEQANGGVPIPLPHPNKQQAAMPRQMNFLQRSVSLCIFA